MQTQLNKVTRGLRKGMEDSMCTGSPFATKTRFAIPLDTNLQHLDVRRNEGAVDVVFQSLLANANQELARLLRDVCKGPRSGHPRRTDNRQSTELLMRAVHCAAKQYMVQAELGNLALKDELTGLYNRRGFYALAERQLKLGRRSGRELLLFFIDVDGLKQINDSSGHSEGDRALKQTAEALKKTFRDSDIIARLGGDEFAVLAVEASGHSEAAIAARLRKYMGASAPDNSQCRVSTSIGVARFDHGNPTSLGELLAAADRAMYEQKRSRAKPQLVAEEACLTI
jgi:diguanylate cyclase (GGDEF)-like protein